MIKKKQKNLGLFLGQFLPGSRNSLEIHFSVVVALPLFRNWAITESSRLHALPLTKQPPYTPT